MNHDMFRKKNMDRMKSPEELNDYIRVSNPGVWILLAAIAVLLIGACVWGYFGRIESTMTVSASVTDGVAVCPVDGAELLSVQPGMDARVGDYTGRVTGIDPDRRRVTIETDAPDGMYPATIILERVRPLSFVFD